MPGKFEGEPEWAQILYLEALEQGADETYEDEAGRTIDLIRVDSVDADNWGTPELEDKTVILWTDDNGFVYTKVFNNEVETENYLRDALGVSDL
jgi:hypothetical protein